MSLARGVKLVSTNTSLVLLSSSAKCSFQQDDMDAESEHSTEDVRRCHHLAVKVPVQVMTAAQKMLSSLGLGLSLPAVYTLVHTAVSCTDLRSGACTRVINCCELCSAALVGIG